MAYVPPHRRCRGQEGSSSSNHFFRTASASDDDVALLCSAFSSIRCINLDCRHDKWAQFERQAKRVGPSFYRAIQRKTAVDGRKLNLVDVCGDGCVQRQWDSTQNARYSKRVASDGNPYKIMTAGEVGCALSHIDLWKELVLCQSDNDDVGISKNMLILEDDAMFTSKRGRSRFAPAFVKVWKELPEDWDMLYLGFSGRGERLYINYAAEPEIHSGGSRPRFKVVDDDLTIRLYKPTYGFHTHAYAITKAGAARLLENLPVVGPIDVWLADNGWFGLSVYCAVIANEGWQLDDGTYEGANLVEQQRKGAKSDIPQSLQV